MQASIPEKPRTLGSNRTYTISMIIMVMLSLCVRLVNLRSPLLEYHGFRQTQTAITVWAMMQEGASILHYQTPVLGSPWQIPFEFPIFQIAAMYVAKLGFQIDVACRLTNILFFYFSALMLYCLCRLHTASRALNTWILGFYLWCPYMIVWSRTSMIDYASVAFALSYLYFMLRWMRDDRRFLLLAFALLIGCLGYLTKITTMVTVLPALAYWSYQHLLPFRRKVALDNKGGCQQPSWRFIAPLAFALIFPIVVGLAWVKHTDDVKSQCIYTVALTSQNLRGWNFGTLAQHLQCAYWSVIFKRLSLLLVAPPIITGVWLARRMDQAGRALFWTALAGSMLPILIFLNLYYVHDYYMIAITPFMSIVVGCGLCALYQEVPKANWLHIATLFCSLYTVYKGRDYILKPYQINYSENLCRVGKAIEVVTPPNAYVVIEDFDWDSSLLYYAKRKGLMLAQWQNITPSVAVEGCTTIVCKRQHLELLSLWKHYQLVNQVSDFSIYRVSNTPL